MGLEESLGGAVVLAEGESRIRDAQAVVDRLLCGFPVALHTCELVEVGILGAFVDLL